MRDNKALNILLTKVLPIIALLFFFLVGVKTLSGSFKMMGGGFTNGLLSLNSSPILGLFSGMLATVLVQSSSATTSIIVGLVAAGSLPISGAVPMIMGANLGTSVTNTLVSLGYVKDNTNFRRAFAAATVHDFFNILSVLVLLPIEIASGFLTKSATALASVLYGTSSGFKFSSPLKAAIKPFAKGIKAFFVDTIALDKNIAGIAMLITSGIIILACLSLIVKITKKVVDQNKNEVLEKLLSKNAYASLLFGALVTFSVQSSSITTSLLVPLAGAGFLSLEAVLPVTVGANIGTTTTALIASLTGNVSGLAIALVHLLFNLCGTLIWFMIPQGRAVVIKLCEGLAFKTEKKRVYGLSYIVVFFFVLPLSLTYVLR